MTDPPSPSILPPRTSVASTLRRRGLPSRAATLEGTNWPQRRNSTLSDSLSEARNSIRSSTDDILLPRVAKDDEPVTSEESHWYSAPLALALLPAIAGVFFRDGSAIVTDVTLLALAAIFLNWSVRLPWYVNYPLFASTESPMLTVPLRDWYRSAQAIQREDGFESPMEIPVDTEFNEHDEPVDAQERPQRQDHTRSTEAKAIKELQIHELAALASCFIFPIIGTWLLHGIRGSLSRPSEGLVSNYNLTIFLLASEVRPFAHLLKLVQARTLHLQRVVSSPHNNEVDSEKVQDLTKRLEELEAHVAEAATTRLSPSKERPPTSPHETYDAPALITHAVTESRKTLQPDIEALNRAVRRYEKRTALSTLQADARFQQLEAQVHDAISLAAAAQRSSASRRSSYAFILLDCICACIVVPAQLAISILNFPSRIMSSFLLTTKRVLGPRHPASQARPKLTKGKALQNANGYKRGPGPQSPSRSRSPAVSPLGQHPSSANMRGSR